MALNTPNEPHARCFRDRFHPNGMVHAHSTCVQSRTCGVRAPWGQSTTGTAPVQKSGQCIRRVSVAAVSSEFSGAVLML